MSKFSASGAPPSSAEGKVPAFADAVQRAKEIASKIRPGAGSGIAPPPAQPAQKRPLNDPFEDAPSGKKPDLFGASSMNAGGMNPGMGNPGMAQIGGAPTTELMMVPDKMVGLIIGRGGEQITRLQAESGCKIQMAQDSQDFSGMPERQCTLTGPPAAIAQARSAIERIIASEGSGPGGGPRGPPAADPGLDHSLLELRQPEMPAGGLRQPLLALGNVFDQHRDHHGLNLPHASLGRRRRLPRQNWRLPEELVEREHVPDRVPPGPLCRLVEREVPGDVLVDLADAELLLRRGEDRQPDQAGEGEVRPGRVEVLAVCRLVRGGRPVPRDRSVVRRGSVFAVVWASQTQELGPALPSLLIQIEAGLEAGPRGGGQPHQPVDGRQHVRGSNRHFQ